MPPPHDQTTDNDVGSLKNPVRFLGQDYQKLFSESLRRKKPFTDDSFPANRSSIGALEDLTELDYNKIQWKRPSDLVTSQRHDKPDQPFFTVDGMSRFDYKQGKLGNCWFLASIGALTTMDNINHVIPPDQSFSKNYAGIFHFRFWRFGKWTDVVVDDLLPTKDNKLIFVASKTSNVFWPALLEKAYAKVCGSYADMDGGFMAEGLTDFTGWVYIKYRLNEAPADLWDIMDRAANSQTLMGCGSQTEDSPKFDQSRGIVPSHAYTVTGVSKVMMEGKPVHLVRLLNPWGHKEWNGHWSDESPLWDKVSEKDRKLRQILDNGEFWMSMKDFSTNYKTLHICCLCPDFLDGSPGCHWKSQRHFGKWVAGTTAGGSIDNKETFWKNFQFRVRIEKSTPEGTNNILVSLMQNHEKRNRKEEKDKMIGFYILKMSGKSILEKKTRPFENKREVMGLFRLEPGEYVIVPCTESPGLTLSFVLSIFSKH